MPLQEANKDSNKFITFIFFVIVSAFVIYYAVQFFYGERVHYNGLGWDGGVYAGFARLSPSALFTQTINPYYFQRILPSIIVHEFAKLFHVDLVSNRNVVLAFYLYNFCLISLGAYLFYRLSKLLGWSIQLRFLCLSLLLLNFPTLKLAVYYTILTDNSAFFVGILSTYCYMRRHTLGLFLSVFFGAFAFPSIIYASAPLIIFPYQEKLKLNGAPFTHTANYLVPAIITIIWVLATWYCASQVDYTTWTWVPPINWKLFPLSLIAISFYTFFATRYFIYPKAILSHAMRQLSLKNTLLYACLFITLKWIISRYANNELPITTVIHYLSWLPYSAVVNPLNAIVAHIMYFGAGVVFLLLLWPSIIRHTYDTGFGCVAFVLLYLLLSFGSESRQLINAWPMFVLLISCTLNEFKISWSFTAGITVLNLVLSRCWLQLNMEGPWGKVFEFPTQMYFMNFGPWMSTVMCAVFSIISVLVIIAIYCGFNRMVIQQKTKIFD